MYRLHGGDSVRFKQTQRDAIVTLDAGTSSNILVLYGSKNKRDLIDKSCPNLSVAKSKSKL